MPFVTVDEIAQGVFATAQWDSLSDVDRRLLGPIHTGVEAAIAIWLNGNTQYTSRDEIISLDYPYPKQTLPTDSTPRGTDLFFLRHVPASVDSIVVYEKAAEEPMTWSAEDILTKGTDYQVEDIETVTIGGSQTKITKTGAIRRIGSVWPFRPGAIRVTYIAGLDIAAFANEWQLIKLATLTAIREHYATAKKVYGIRGSVTTGEIKSETIGKYSYTTADGTSIGMLDATSVGGVTASARSILQPLVDYGQYF